MAEKEWKPFEKKVEWITITEKISLTKKPKFKGYCECGTKFEVDGRNIQSILKGSSKVFHCQTCFEKNIELPSDGEWKWVKGFETRYCISSDGRVRNFRQGNLLSPCLDSGGYLVTKCGGGSSMIKIHRSVAEHFIPNPDDMPYVGFKDGNKLNCSVENLFWCYGEVEDLLGKRSERLTVVALHRVPFGEKDKVIRWECLCDCGNSVFIQTADFTSGHTRSCGCLKTDTTIERNTTHGLARTPEYVAWQAAKARTTNPNVIQSKDYLGRGIIMEEPWFSSFETFLEDMGPRPTPRHSVERVNVNGNYCKENCVWGEPDIQAFNQRKRKTNTSGRTGVYWVKSINKWDVRIKNQRIFQTSDFELACFVRSEAELHYYGFTKE